MVEINNEVFSEGDIIRFERATLPENRERDYRITAVTPGGIEVSASGFNYQYTHANAARLGITRAPQDSEETAHGA